MWTLGLIFLAYYFLSRHVQDVNAHNSVNDFRSQIGASARVDTKQISESRAKALSASTNQSVDMRLWSAARIAEFLDLQENVSSPPEALLHLDSLNSVVPVYIGTDDRTLNRGAGWIEYTSKLDEIGNIGIAAHRDSFFRVLKNIQEGHLMRLEMPGVERVFKVSKTEIVDPSNVDVLNETENGQLTLVTCYPFYHVGKAPKRFIVFAEEVPSKFTVERKVQ